jgi:hypothetical protein
MVWYGIHPRYAAPLRLKRSHSMMNASTSSGLYLTDFPSFTDGKKGRRRPFECSNTHALLTPSQCATSFAPSNF